MYYVAKTKVLISCTITAPLFCFGIMQKAGFNTGQGFHNAKVDDGLESYIDTDNVKPEELEQRLGGRGMG